MDQVADFMARQYTGKIIPVYTDYCPECLKKGKPDVLNVPKDPGERRAFWAGLFEEKTLDPCIVLNCFIPAHAASTAHFSKSLIDLGKPGKACTQGMQCDPVCIFCHCIVDKSRPHVVTKSEVPLNVHQGCLSQCTYVEPGSGKKHQCKAMVPRIPSYFQCFQIGVCTEHGRLMREAPSGVPLGALGAARQQTLKRFEPPMQFAAPPPPVPKPPAVKPSSTKPSSTKPPAPTKLSRLGEDKYTHDIRSMFKETAKEPYQRPEVVFTPHASATKARSKRRRRNFDSDDSQ